MEHMFHLGPPETVSGTMVSLLFLCGAAGTISQAFGPAGRFFDDDRGLNKSATGNERRSEVIAINVVILFGTSRLGSYSIVKELRPIRVR